MFISLILLLSMIVFGLLGIVEVRKFQIQNILWKLLWHQSWGSPTPLQTIPIWFALFCPVGWCWPVDLFNCVQCILPTQKVPSVELCQLYMCLCVFVSALGCSAPDQYQCPTSGECFESFVKCDNRLQCRDGSDEVDCGRSYTHLHILEGNAMYMYFEMHSYFCTYISTYSGSFW